MENFDGIVYTHNSSLSPSECAIGWLALSQYFCQFVCFFLLLVLARFFSFLSFAILARRQRCRRCRRRRHIIIYFYWWMWFGSITSSSSLAGCSLRWSGLLDSHIFVGDALIRRQTDIEMRERASALPLTHTSPHTNFAHCFRILAYFRITFSASPAHTHTHILTRAEFDSVDCTNVYFRGKTFSIETYKSGKAGLKCARGCEHDDDGERSCATAIYRSMLCASCVIIFEHLFTHRTLARYTHVSILECCAEYCWFEHATKLDAPHFCQTANAPRMTRK